MEHPIGKATTLTEEGKNKPAGWAEVHAVFPAVLEELDSGKLCCVLVTAHG